MLCRSENTLIQLLWASSLSHILHQSSFSSLDPKKNTMSRNEKEQFSDLVILVIDKRLNENLRMYNE